MSFSERPQAWCTPIGLLAVIGPSRNDQRGPPAVCARSFSKIRFSSQKRSIARSIAGKSGTFGTDRYIFIWDRWQKGSATPEKPILASASLPLAPGPTATLILMARVDKAPRFSAEEAVQFARELYGLDAVASPLPSERDQNFHLRDASGAQFILKIANQEESPAVLDLQNSLIGFLGAHPTGLEFPHVVPATTGATIASVNGPDGAPYFVRLLTWVDGICMAQAAAPHSAELLRSLGAALARVDNSLEAFSHPAAHRALHWDPHQAALARPHLDLLPEPQRRLIEPIFDTWAQLDWSALRTSVIYNDANDYNILVDTCGSRVVSLLDFGDVVYSATVCDLAIALA